ncbi:MAG: hypothetical protein RSG52_15860 [Terrisporobacter sp.]|uniref:hypothetical protein n=1 Tax=Terrisporobacter sp. TaxID=1965305 RepID=UPI002FC5B37F
MTCTKNIKIVIIICILFLSIGLVACSTKEDVSSNDVIFYNPNIVVANDDIVNITFLGKQKLGDIVGYMCSIENKSENNIKVYTKDTSLYNKKVELDLSYDIESNTKLNALMCVFDIKSLKDLCDIKGTICIETENSNEEIKEYSFELD